MKQYKQKPWEYAEDARTMTEAITHVSRLNPYIFSISFHGKNGNIYSSMGMTEDYQIYNQHQEVGWMEFLEKQERGRFVTFGWETDAVGEEYQNFLSQFLPERIRFIREHNLESTSYFHVSDEPVPANLEAYRKAKDSVMKYLDGFPVIDALSDYDFYRQGIVKRPVPANDHIGLFLENGVQDLWTYYCCAQYKGVSNRFFNMPSSRNRITGCQLYKFNIAGFLHWGYNHWYSRLSLKQLDPYRVTDADCAFPSGDAFLVYPGEDGRPVSSIRFEVFHEALQDLRAFELLESFIGKEQVVELLEEGLAEQISFGTYPRDQAWLLEKREQVNRKIKELVPQHLSR